MKTSLIKRLTGRSPRYYRNVFWPSVLEFLDSLWPIILLGLYFVFAVLFCGAVFFGFLFALFYFLSYFPVYCDAHPVWGTFITIILIGSMFLFLAYEQRNSEQVSH
ncbi:MAG: hypothetical protein WCL02_05365 [bacterium]